jgi:hypothetical protein
VLFERWASRSQRAEWVYFAGIDSLGAGAPRSNPSVLRSRKSMVYKDLTRKSFKLKDLATDTAQVFDSKRPRVEGR